MKVPTVLEVANKKTIIDLSVNLMRDCIAQIYNGDEIFETKDLEPSEVEQFVDNLTICHNSKKIKDFFETLPVIKHTIKYKNSKSGMEHEMLLQGASDFFQLNLLHESLESFFRTNFALMQYHKYSLGDLEGMLLWEREIYVETISTAYKRRKRKDKRKTKKRIEI